MISGVSTAIMGSHPHYPSTTKQCRAVSAVEKSRTDGEHISSYTKKRNTGRDRRSRGWASLWAELVQDGTKKKKIRRQRGHQEKERNSSKYNHLDEDICRGGYSSRMDRKWKTTVWREINPFKLGFV
jgi:hypothetical protein